MVANVEVHFFLIFFYVPLPCHLGYNVPRLENSCQGYNKRSAASRGRTMRTWGFDAMAGISCASPTLRFCVAIVMCGVGVTVVFDVRCGRNAVCCRVVCLLEWETPGRPSASFFFYTE